MLVRSIFKHTFYYSLANQIPSLANLFLLPIYSEYLKIDDYTVYGLVLAYSGFFNGIMGLGFSINFQKAFYDTPENFSDSWSKMLGFLGLYRFLFGILFFYLLSLLLSSYMSYHDSVIISLIVIGPLIFIELIKSVGSRFFQYTHNHRVVYRISMVTSIISIGCTYVFIVILHLGFYSWFLSQLIISIIQGCIYGYYLITKTKVTFKFNIKVHEAKALLRTALPMIPSEYTGYVLSSSDRIVMDRYGVNHSQIGNYNIAYSFASYFEFIQFQVNQILTPVYFDLLKRGDDESISVIAKITNLWTYIAVTLAALIGLWIPEIFRFLFVKPELYAGYNMAIFLVFSFTYRSVFVCGIDTIYYLGKTSKVLKISVISAMANLLINFLLIKSFGVVVAVTSTFLSYWLMSVLPYFMEIKNLPLRLKINPIRKFLVVALIALVIFFCADYSVNFKTFLSAIVILCWLVYYKVKGRELINRIEYGYRNRI